MVTIQPINESLSDSFRTCLDEVCREGWLAFQEAPPTHAVREFIAANVRRNIPQFVALDEGRVIGWCDISPKELPGFTHCGRLGMGSLKPYRGSGIGTQLMQACLDKAKQQGLERIELEVFSFNESAIALYKKLGFTVEGTNHRARKRAGEYDDIVWMALLLK